MSADIMAIYVKPWQKAVGYKIEQWTNAATDKTQKAPPHKYIATAHSHQFMAAKEHGQTTKEWTRVEE